MYDPVAAPRRNSDSMPPLAMRTDVFQTILKIKMITVQVNGNEMAWVCENSFGTKPNIQMAYSIETFAGTTTETC